MAILKAAIKERQAGKPAEEIYKTYQGQVRPNSALAMAIASVPDPERKRRYALLNYVLVALLVLLALSNLMAGPVRLVLFGLCMLIFAFAIARFDGRVYPVLFLLLLISALNSLVHGELLDLVLVAAVIAVAFVAQRKIFPNVGPFGVKKSVDGSYIWYNQERRFAEPTAASSSIPPATPLSPVPPAATPQLRRNWWSRNWKWFVPAGCLTMLVCLALVVCAFVLVAISAVKSSSFYQTGVAHAKSDERVQAALGSNLHEGMFLPGDTRKKGSLREYEFRIPISGSKGKGTIYLVVAKSAGQYQIDNLSVKTNGGEIIDLNETNPSSASNAARDQSNPATAQSDSNAKPLFNSLNPSRALGTSPHIRGDPDASVTLEVFEDFACKPCAQQSESLKQLEQTYHGKVQVIFRNFPLASDPHAREAAYAAEAAGLQGRFWEMHDILYRDQADWVDSGAIAVCASKIGLSIARFLLDSMSEAVRQRVEADQKKGVELGVTRLPATFLNGRLLDLRSLNPRELRSEIDAALNGLSPSTAPQIKSGVFVGRPGVTSTPDGSQRTDDQDIEALFQQWQAVIDADGVAEEKCSATRWGQLAEKGPVSPADLSREDWREYRVAELGRIETAKKCLAFLERPSTKARMSQLMATTERHGFDQRKFFDLQFWRATNRRMIASNESKRLIEEHWEEFLRNGFPKEGPNLKAWQRKYLRLEAEEKAAREERHRIMARYQGG
jgi:protein-disulfide isomerase